MKKKILPLILFFLELKLHAQVQEPRATPLGEMKPGKKEDNNNRC